MVLYVRGQFVHLCAQICVFLCQRMLSQFFAGLDGKEDSRAGKDEDGKRLEIRKD